jgi:hypothetical protein
MNFHGAIWTVVDDCLLCTEDVGGSITSFAHQPPLYRAVRLSRAPRGSTSTHSKVAAPSVRCPGSSKNAAR